MEKVHYSYQDMVLDLHHINRTMVLEKWSPDYILGIARGGLVPAVFLSHWWEIPLITVNVSYRDNMVSNGINEECLLLLNDVAELVSSGKNILMVDDICDSGVTLNEIRKVMIQGAGFSVTEHLKSAVLVHNTAETLYEPDYCGTEINKVENPSWVVFYWENLVAE